MHLVRFEKIDKDIKLMAVFLSELCYEGRKYRVTDDADYFYVELV